MKKKWSLYFGKCSGIKVYIHRTFLILVGWIFQYARFLLKYGIDSISFNPDALLSGINNINEAEKMCQEFVPSGT